MEVEDYAALTYGFGIITVIAICGMLISYWIGLRVPNYPIAISIACTMGFGFSGMYKLRWADRK